MEEATGPSQAPPLLPPSKVNPYAAYLHDAVLLYAEILMEVVTAGSDFRDGRRLSHQSERFQSTTLQGK